MKITATRPWLDDYTVTLSWPKGPPGRTTAESAITIALADDPASVTVHWAVLGRGAVVLSSAGHLLWLVTLSEPLDPK